MVFFALNNDQNYNIEILNVQIAHSQKNVLDGIMVLSVFLTNYSLSINKNAKIVKFVNNFFNLYIRDQSETTVHALIF